MLGEIQGRRNIREQVIIRLSRDSLLRLETAATVAKHKPTHNGNACLPDLLKVPRDEFPDTANAYSNVFIARAPKILSIHPPGVVHTKGESTVVKRWHGKSSTNEDGSANNRRSQYAGIGCCRGPLCHMLLTQMLLHAAAPTLHKGVV